MMSTILGVTPAGDDHQVVSVSSPQGEGGAFMKSPCADCPWKRSSTGIFPAEAFAISAKTAYDMAESTFGCHCSGTENPRTCAGFLLVNSDHNLKVRLLRMQGETFEGLNDGGHDLFSSYREMAIANGVSPNDPALNDCRDCGYQERS